MNNKLSVKVDILKKFMNYCDKTGLEKKVLDCGAGGSYPSLYLFKEQGYDTYGIDISDSQIDKAEQFMKENNMNLNIKKGNMTDIDFPDETFSFTFSYNSIFHMKKEDIEHAIGEIRRVTKKDGLCFLNFLSIDDCRYQKGQRVGYEEFIQIEGDGDDNKALHSYFHKDEAEEYIDGFEIIYKEQKNRIEKDKKGKKNRYSYINYILKKI